MESSTISRRAVTRGAAWSIPAVAITSASPAIAASGVTVTTTSLPVGYVGETYTAPLTATGGSAPYSWTGTASAPGTTVTPSGAISGTPTQAGGYTPSVVATAAGGGSGTATLKQSIGVNRSQATAEMLAEINARRSSIGVAALMNSADLAGKATMWADHLASVGGGLVHQNPLPQGVNGENLSATCDSHVPADDSTKVGSDLVAGWLSEPHSYADWQALNATDPAKAQEMYSGLMPDPARPGQYIKSTTYPVASGHRINLENPSFKSVGLGMALSDHGSACGDPQWTYGYYGAAEFAR